jgi:histidine ammonia-lyase
VTLTLTRRTTLASWNRSGARTACPLDARRRAGVEAAAAGRAAAAGGEAVYGVNTGFGKLASVRIKPGTPSTCSAT